MPRSFTAQEILMEALPVPTWSADATGLCTYFNKAWLEFTGRRLDQEFGNGWTEGVHRAIIEAFPDFLFVLDADGRFIDYHAQNPDLLYAQAQIFLGKSIQDVLPSEALNKIIPAFQEVLRTKQVRSAEYALNVNGVAHWYEARLAFSGNSEVVSVVRDITDRKLAESILRESALRLRAVFDNSSDGIFIHNPDGTVIDVNERALELYGVTRREALRFQIKDYSDPMEPVEILPELWRSVVAGKTYVFEWKARRPKDGSIFDVEVSLRRIEFELGRPVVLARVRDLTERKRTEEERSRRLQENIARAAAEKALEELQQEKEIRERFIALLTHDLRNPLAAARMSGELLGRESSNRELSKVLSASVVSNLDRIDQMIQDLLDASLIRAGRELPLRREHCELRAVVSGAVDDLRRVHGNIFTLRADELIAGNWDPDAIRRVVENLCNNAVKYGTPNTPIEVTLSRREKRAVLSVHNEGRALTRPEQESIFLPFRRASVEKKGWGIGLTVVKGLAESHGGAVRVESETGRGTTFFIELPIVDLQKQAA